MEKESSFVVLSIVYPPDDPYLKNELERLRQLLPANISIITGGRLVQSYRNTLMKIGAHVIEDLNQFRILLSGRS